MEPVEISEAGLLLRPWRAADAEDVFRACQAPDIQRWTGVPSPYLMQHAVEYVTNLSATAWRDGTAATFAVIDAETAALLGSCGLVSVDRVRNSAEIGYWTAPWARGRGVATRATCAVSRWAFQTLGLARLIWQAEIGNHASRLVALRAGFRIEGQLRLAQVRPGGSPQGWIGSLLPGEVPEAAGADARDGPAGRDSLETRRAAVFGRAQPVLHAALADGWLILRPPTLDDVDALLEVARDPVTTRWTTLPHPYEQPNAENYVRVRVPGLWAQGDGAAFAIAGSDGRLAGTISLHISPQDPAVAEIGCMVAPHVRGRGYAPAALRAVAEWAIAELGVERVVWQAFVGNESSLRVARKAGFTEEGIARSGLARRGARSDTWVTALVAADVRAPRRPTPTPPEAEEASAHEG